MPTNTRPPLVIIIRDGWGHNPHPEHDAFNAVKLARTPVADRLMRQWPNTLITTCGEDVGLPPGTMGNSEVGHQNIGAGRIVDQELMRITRAIRNGSFFENPAFLSAIAHAKKTGGKLHLLGLVSNGQVHSDIEHLVALIDLAAHQKFPSDRLFVHAITDGRDTPPRSSVDFLQTLEKALSFSRGRIASVIGRYYAMDRDNRWERVKRAYDVSTGRHTSGLNADVKGVETLNFPDAISSVRQYYEHPTDPSRQGDEFITPRTIGSEPDVSRIRDHDSVIFFNFRGDRPRELVRAFMLDDDSWRKVVGGGFDRGSPLRNLFFCSMSNYEQGLCVSAIAFEKPPKMINILGEAVSNAGLTQFRCAETEKFPHVTFFFNDYREPPFPGENRELIQSPKDVTTYDQKPQMSAHGVCEAVLRRLSAHDCEALLIVNFANPDMVGHTGNLDATIRAVEVVDECVGRIVDATLAPIGDGGGRGGGNIIITADHGNAEQMWDPIHNCPHTAHTVYDVPLIAVGEAVRGCELRKGGKLADIAPTALSIMELHHPVGMSGRSLVL